MRIGTRYISCDRDVRGPLIHKLAPVAVKTVPFDYPCLLKLGENAYTVLIGCA